jgi:hypothetical protein
MDLKNIPEDKHSELDKRLSFVRGSGKKLVRSENEDIQEDRMIDVDNGENIEIKESFVQRIQSIGQAEEGSTEVDEEQVKERLEELGYM